MKIDNWTAKRPAVGVATVVLVMASAGLVVGSFGVSHWMEVAVVQEQVAWDWTVQPKVPVERLRRHFAVSMAVTQEAGQVIALMLHSGQKNQAPRSAAPADSAIVQGNYVVAQLAFARVGSAGPLDDALVTGLCPYEMMSTQLSDHSQETSEVEKHHYLLLM